MKVILSGGATGGSVTPLLSVANELNKKIQGNVDFLFIGTKKGYPERVLVERSEMEYHGIHSGKLRRYFAWQNFLDPFKIILGFFESLFILLKYRPDVIFSAGGFVSVPLIWAGFFLGIPTVIHQQDIRPSLSNKLTSCLAKKITVSFKKSLNDFPKTKTILTGNPVRKEILLGNKERAIKRFNLERNLPTILVIGGGTGAEKINQLIFSIIPQLVEFCQVIHLTGKDKLSRFAGSRTAGKINSRYHSYEFLTEEIADAYAAADLVISRAGMGVLTELAVLAKPAIIIPIPQSHQEANALYFAKNKAIILLNQAEGAEELRRSVEDPEERKRRRVEDLLEPKPQSRRPEEPRRRAELTPEVFLPKIKKVLNSQELLSDLSRNISSLAQKRAGEKIAEIISSVAKINSKYL